MMENSKENVVKIITKNGFCPACMMSKNVMKANGIKFHEVHIDNDIEAKKHLHDLHIMAYPVVEPDGQLDKTSWWGFRPERIQQLAK